MGECLVIFTRSFILRPSTLGRPHPSTPGPVFVQAQARHPPKRTKKLSIFIYIYIYISIYPAVSPYKATTLPHFMYTHLWQSISRFGTPHPSQAPIYRCIHLGAPARNSESDIYIGIYIWAQDSSMLVYTSAFLCIGGAGTLVCSVAQGGLSTRFVRTSRA